MSKVGSGYGAPESTRAPAPVGTCRRPGPARRPRRDRAPARGRRPGGRPARSLDEVELLVALLGRGRRPVQEARQLPRAHRVAQLAHGLGLDLAHALARDAEDAADLLERVGVAVADAVAQLDDLALAEGERREHVVDALLEHLVAGGLHRAL